MNGKSEQEQVGSAEAAQPGGVGGVAPPASDATSATQPVAPVAPAPQFASLEQLVQLQGAIAAQGEQQRRMLEALQAQQAQAPPEPEVSDDALATAYAEGKLGPTIRRLVEQRIERAVREHVEPLRAEGAQSIAELTLEVAKARMPLYDRVKGEMDGFLRQMPAQVRMKPEALRLAYEAAVGRNFDRLAAEQTEGKLRQMAAAGGTALPSGQTGRGQSGPGNGSKVLSAQELFGAEAAHAVHEKGGEDVFARKMGFKDWPDYVTQCKDHM